MIGTIIIGYLIFCVILNIFFPDLLKDDKNSEVKSLEFKNEPEKPKSVFSYNSYGDIARAYSEMHGVQFYSASETTKFTAQEFRSALLRTNIVALQKKQNCLMIFEDTISNIEIDLWTKKPTVILGDGNYYSREESGRVREKFVFFLSDDKDNMDAVGRLKLTDKVMLIGVLKADRNEPYFVETIVVKVNDKYLPYLEELVVKSK